MAQLTIQQAFDLAVEHHQAGRLREAEQLYRQILAQHPQHVGAMHHLGVIANQVGRNDVAVDLIRRAIALRPDYAEAYSNLGKALKDNEQLDDAIAAYRQAIALRPNSPKPYNNLGNALGGKGQLDAAIAAFRQAVALRPDYAAFHSNLGNALQEKGELDGAMAACRQAIALRPNYAEAHSNLGNALREKGQLKEAIAAYRQAIALRPDFPEAYNNLSNALKDKGQLEEAIAACRQATALRPNYVQAYSNLVYNLLFHPEYGGHQILKASRAWAQQYERPLAKEILPHSNDPTPDRRLRIGYVSPDFREHCQVLFMLPLLAHHNHEAFEIAAYSSVRRVDAFTDRLRSYVDLWHDIGGLSDATAADKIRADRIDILVDLTLHMGQNRMLLFCRKPAPVQVTWLGYPGTTGLSAMDYRLSDPFLDPPGNDASYSETTLRLPQTFWCYDPLSAEPKVSKLPALANGYVTFGCLNNFCKVQQVALRLWARVLAQVSDSHLLLLCPEGEHRAALQSQFAGKGIDPQRIEFVAYQPRPAYLRTYHRIDLGLDTLPYNGHTTSLDAMWMGVLVITRVGTTVVGRAGFSQLSNLGLTELVAWNDDDFVRIAVDWANDLPRLAELRGTLRSRMQRSPLMDAPRFAVAIEAAYRLMWVNWCAGASSPQSPSR